MRALSTAILVAATVAVASPAAAHHWYPDFCCHEDDCFTVVPGEDVRLVPGGYEVVATGELISVEQARESPPEANGEWARCTEDSDPKNPTRCVDCAKACFFVPPAGG